MKNDLKYVFLEGRGDKRERINRKKGGTVGRAMITRCEGNDRERELVIKVELIFAVKMSDMVREN